jgi:hypothetical protein
MKRHFETSGVILDYLKWDSIISNLLAYQDNLFMSHSKNEFDFMFHLSKRIITKNIIIYLFKDCIDDIQNQNNSESRNQIYEYSICVRNLSIYFNQPGFDRWNYETELELLINNLRDEPNYSGSCRAAFKNLIMYNDEPINTLQINIITLVTLKQRQNNEITRTQLLEYIIELDIHQRNIYNKIDWFTNLNLIPEINLNAGEGIINFDQFSAAAEVFVQSLEPQKQFSQGAADDET